MSKQGLRGYRRYLGLFALMAMGSVTADSSTSLSWKWVSPRPSGSAFYAVAYGGGEYVAAGADGALFSSPDGSTWTAQSSAIKIGGAWMDAIYGNGRFVLVGFDAAHGTHVAESSDGVHWTDHTLALETYPFGLLGYGSGSYVLVGRTAIATSSDGLTWQIRDPGFTPAGRIAFANGVFVALGAPGEVHFSIDNGSSWKLATDQPGGFSDLASDGSHLLLTETSFDPQTGYVSSVAEYRSTDGDHWTKLALSGNPPAFGTGPVPLMWDGSRFFTLASPSNSADSDAYVSPDGITWTDLGSVNGGLIYSSLTAYHPAAAAAAGYIAVLRDDPLTLLTSSDLVNWTADSLATGTAPSGGGVIHGGGMFVQAGSAHFLASPDGVNWSQVYTPPTDIFRGPGLAYGGGRFVAAAQNIPHVGYYDSYSQDQWFYSTGGTTWNQAVSPPGATAIADPAYGNGLFGAFTSACTGYFALCTQVTFETSADGNTWVSNAVPADLLSAAAYANLSFYQGYFTAIGQADAEGKATVFTSRDGKTWSATGSLDVGQRAFFTRVRVVDGRLFAMGGIPMLSIISHGKQWTASNYEAPLIKPGVEKAFPFSDVIFDGQDFITSTGATSPDGINWCNLHGLPWNFFVGNTVSDGVQLIGIGTNGIVAAALPAGHIPCTAATADFSFVPAGSQAGDGGKSSGGSGDMSLWVLTLLLGFAVRRASLLKRDSTCGHAR